MEENTLSVLKIAPGQYPQQVEIDNDLKGLQQAVGGSGSGKTRFWLKPNLLQCHSSYVVTDPKRTILL